MRRFCLAGLFAALLVAGCSRSNPRPIVRVVEPDQSDPRKVVVDTGKKDGDRQDVRPVVPPDQVVASLPEPTRDERYEAALLEAVDFLAEKKYTEALAALEKAQKYRDTGTVQREIDKVRAVLAQDAAAAKAVDDVKTVLDDGKAAEAAQLANQALASHGGGSKADDLARLKQQADAVVTAAGDDSATRRAALQAEATRALADQNLRGAAVALEQAIALKADDELSRKLDDVRDRLKTYDDNCRLADDVRRDATRLEEGLACLRKARAAWDTLQVRQEIDEFTLLLERRRERIAVADFEVRGDVGIVGAGRTVAEELLPHFKPRFAPVERAQLGKVLDELNLQAGDLAEGAGRRELGRLARVRYLVVGSITPIAGVTVQARLIEVSTGLVVQTARASAPNLDALLRLLPQVALLLQMTDEQKLAYEARLAQVVHPVAVVDDTPVTIIAPPPPPPAEEAPPPPIVTYTARPPVLGNVVIQDFAVFQAPPPPAAVVVIQGKRRHRLLRLCLELGDNLFRRGHCREAERHFSLALTLAGPRREISLRLDTCRRLVPPPPPVVVVAAPRPRLAVLGFYCGGDPGLVPAALGDWAADSVAPYLGGNYELIDRGEVCWYMGRLGLTMRDLLRDAEARLCLARALHARFFVFGTVQPTASFNVDTHLVDAETGARTGTASIHVKDQQELKLRAGELAQQMGVQPAEQKKLAQQAAATEKALNDTRALLAKEPSKAAEAARAGLKAAPGNVALQALLTQAQQKERLAAFEEARRKEAAVQAQALAQAKKRQQDLAQQAAVARARATAEAKTRSKADLDRQQRERQRGADQLRQQAKQASAAGDPARAAQLLQSAAALKPGADVFLELGQARAAADKARLAAAEAERQKREKARLAQAEAAQKRILADREARMKADAARTKALQTHDQAVHDSMVAQAKALLAKKDYEHALVAAQTARKVKASPVSADLVQQAQRGLTLVEAEKKGAAERLKAEEEVKKRAADQALARKNQETYSAALTAGQKAVQAKRYDEAIAQYTAALKLFRTDAALSGLKTAQDLRKREQDALAAETKRKADEANRTRKVKDLVAQGQKALSANQQTKAADLFRQAVRLAPDSAEAQAGLSRAEQELAAQAARTRAAVQEKERLKTFKSLFDRAKAEAAKNRKPEAIKLIRAALEFDPNNAEAKTLLAKLDKSESNYQVAMSAGQSAMKAKNYRGAVNSYNEALRLKTNDAAALAARNEAQRLLDTAFGEWMKQADALVKVKKYNDAVKAADEALKLRPDDPAATKTRTAALAALKAPPPPDPKAVAYQNWMKQGQAAMAAKKYADAVKAYDEALKQKPSDAAAIQGKKSALDAMKPPVKPAPDPKDAAYQTWLKQGQTALTTKKWATAIQAFDEALKVRPGDAMAIKGKKDATDGLKAEEARQREAAYQGWMKQGQAAMAAKKYADAVKAYDEALKQKPGDAAASGGKKAALDAMKPPVKPPVKPVVNAQAEYTKTMQQAAALEKQKKYSEAAAAYRKALDWVPGDPATNAALKPTQGQAWLGVARNEHAQKRYAEAVKAYEEVLKRIPNQPEAKAALPRAKANKP
jgi:tetratricopeptide (TPR) repeat protein